MGRQPPDKDWRFADRTGENALGLDSYYQIQLDYIRGCYTGERSNTEWVDLGGDA